jgi:hypothetical protein
MLGGSLRSHSVEESYDCSELERAGARDLRADPRLCVNFTTNGLRLTEELLSEMRGKYGQIRLSLYEDNNYASSIGLLVTCGARFGVNRMVVPQMLPTFENQVRDLIRKGVRDFLFLRYKGSDNALHLSFDEIKRFGEIVARLYLEFRSAVTLKLDICWGQEIGGVPLLFTINDCGAGDEFLSITSDKKVKICSFVETADAIAFNSTLDLQRIWGRVRGECEPLSITGCGRRQSASASSLQPLVQIGDGC